MCHCDNKSRFVCYGNRGGGGCSCICHHPDYQPRMYYQTQIETTHKTLFGSRIKALMNETGDSQRTLAEKLGGLHQSCVSKWVNGKCLPDPETIPVICKVFGLSWDDLLGDMPYQIRAKYQNVELKFSGTTQH